MNDRKKVIVTINGQEYTVVSIEPEEYIKQIAKYVDESIKEILDKNSKLSNTMAAVLAGFNIADRYYKNANELRELKQNVEKPLSELENIKKELEETKIKMDLVKEESEEKIKKITEQSEATTKALKEESEPYKEELLECKKEVENLTKKNKKCESAIQIKDDELLNNQKIINDLQDKIFEHQMEIVQMKKQLDESLKLLDK